VERRSSIVAVVEDDPSMRRSIERLLTVLGCKVEGFSSAEALLERGHLDQLGCLVLDIHLPGMSGFELRDRMTETGSSLPTIFITAIEDDDVEAAAVRLGCVAYLHKPFSPDLLVSAVNRALSDRTAR
jgi:FixJ family two-component response regulator